MNSRVSRFSYDGTLEGFLSVMDYCIDSHIMPTHIHSDYIVLGTPDENKYLRIATNYERANRIYRIVGRHSSPEVQQMISDCFLTCLPDMEMDLFIMICKAIKYGAVIAEDYSDELMRRVQFGIRDLYREAQSTVNTLNTIKFESVTYAMINPRNNVLPIIYKSILNNTAFDDLLIYDKRHNIALMRIGENSSIVDIKRIMNTEIRTVEDLKNRIWYYFKETDNMPMRDVRSIRADSLTRLWYIAS